MVHHTKKHRKRHTRKRNNTKRRVSRKRMVVRKGSVARERRATHKRRARSKKTRRAGACCGSRPKRETQKPVRKTRQSTSTTSTKSSGLVYNSRIPSEDVLLEIYEDVQPIQYLNSEIPKDMFMEMLQDNPSKSRIKLYGGEKYKFENLDIHRNNTGTYYMYISNGEVANSAREQVKLIQAIKYLIAPSI